MDFNRNKPYLFISYSHCENDKVKVDKFVEKLKTECYNLWIDKEINPGDDWTEKAIPQIIEE